MEIAKQVFDMLPEDGDKLSEKELKALTDLNLGQIKEAKKFLKENGLTKAYKGRGGYVSLVEGAKFPEEENTMSAGEKRAASRAATKAKEKERAERREVEEKVLAYVEKLPEAEKADEIQIEWVNLKWWDVFYAWIWHDGKAKGYKVYTEDM
jgi:DNA-binding GntR family transcriptional regulator